MTTEQREASQSKNEYAVISGSFGTGKTTALVQRAADCAQRTGGRILFLVFNVMQKKQIQQLVAKSDKNTAEIFVDDFFSFMGKYKSSLGLYAENDSLSAKYQLPESGDYQAVYSGIFIDDVQDYETCWLQSVERLCRQEGELVCAYNPQQNIYARKKLQSYFRLAGYKEYSLTACLLKCPPTEEYLAADLAAARNFLLANFHAGEAGSSFLLAQLVKPLRKLAEMLSGERIETNLSFETEAEFQRFRAEAACQQKNESAYRKLLHRKLDAIRYRKRAEFIPNTKKLNMATIHSMQGLYADKVFLLLADERKFADGHLQRLSAELLLPTATTRAKKKLYVIKLK